MTSFNRRQMLKALGLAGLVGHLKPGLGRAAPPSFPTRVVFFVQPHGQVPVGWNMPVEGPTDAYAERSLEALKPEDFSDVLRPLYPFRKKLLAIEGLAHTSVLFDLKERYRTNSGDGNNHNIAVAGILTCALAAQHSGFPCTGGAVSIDQVLGARTQGPGRFATRVYGADYVPNQTVAPFSFIGASKASPIVADPSRALSDLLGQSATTNRDKRLAAQRASVLDSVALEYDTLAPQLASADRQKLNAHRDLIRSLEQQVRTPADGCSGTVDLSGAPIDQFMRVIRLALACDLTRVVTYVAPVPSCPEFGYPANTAVHASFAHASVKGATSCGQVYSPTAERAMIDLGAWYGAHLAALLTELDAVPEGDGTLLDHTIVVWVTELATPTHTHHDVCTAVIGGGNGFFRPGRYVRYPRTITNPLANQAMIGPAHTKLFVSVMQAMGQPDDSFGLTDVTSSDGTPISMTGGLTELQT